MKKQVLKADQAKKKTLIADIRRPVRKLLDDYLTIGAFSPSNTMQNDGKKSENAGEGQNERNQLRIRAKKWSQRSESNREPVHYKVSYIAVISNLEQVC